MNTQPEEQDASPNSAYNPFPEPQTIPSGWDLSEFTFSSQADVGKDEDISAES